MRFFAPAGMIAGMERKRIHLQVTGIVQGVGFRPYVHKLVEKLSLAGWVRNTAAGAEIALEGDAAALAAFVSSLRENPPRLALIEDIREAEEPVQGEEGFVILPSPVGERPDTLVSPDVCTCPDCLRELFDPADRRYRYPFINCTNCGPRYTIIRAVPYDRERTTMAPFPMCPACRLEYEDIADRRYHAQPNACPVCGPRLWFAGADGRELPGDAITLAQQALEAGKVVAVKGLGGFHLAARADSPELAKELRRRKHRDEKPFAVMCADVEEARRFAEISPEEEDWLTSQMRPIVLVKKRDPEAFPWLSENGRIGVMLPYTPVHFLLLAGDRKSLIMTSANLSDRPIVGSNEEALSELAGVTDAFLLHDRAIRTQCDDSVLWADDGATFARRSRGFVPMPLAVPALTTPVLACGAEQKATFTLGSGGRAIASGHIGDLKNAETYAHFTDQVAHLENLFAIHPAAIACDLHPDYLSTAYAEERAEADGLPLIRVQHHHAHMVSCLADNGLTGPAIGIVWDGTGLGTDGTVWGGEFLAGDAAGFKRLASLLPIPLPGSDRAVHEPWRQGLSLLFSAFPEEEAVALSEQLFTEIPAADRRTVSTMIARGVNCPVSSGMGRLFDGVSALLGLCLVAGYEGQGAVLLEAEGEKGGQDAMENSRTSYEVAFTEEDGLTRFDWRPLVRQLTADRLAGVPAAVCARAFQETLLRMAVRQCVRIRQETGLNAVVLSGGTFQNQFLKQKLPAALREEGFEAYTHRRVSPNDEGLSLGQAVIAEARLRAGQ